MSNPWDDFKPQATSGPWDDFKAPDKASTLSPTEGSSQIDVAKFAMDQVQQAFPWNRLRAATLDPLAQKVSDVGLAAGYPNTGAAIGTAIKLSPEILSAYTSLNGLYNSPSPIAQGITKTPQEIGQAMNAGEQAAGINPQLPVRSGTLARFPKTNPDVITVTPEGTAIPGSTPLNTVPDVVPTQYPKNTNALLNHIDNRITQFGDKLNPQELSDYKKILPEMFNKGEIVRGTPQYAMASRLSGQVGDLYNNAVPGRADLNAAYGVSKKLHPDLISPIQNYIQKYGKGALKEAIGYALGGAVANKLFK